MKKIFIAWLILVFIGAPIAFSVIIPDIGFPYKGFVYQSIGIPNSNLNMVEILSNTRNQFNIKYQGTNYKASLFTFGAIYMEREGRNPVVITFDVKEFRSGGRFRY